MLRFSMPTARLLVFTIVIPAIAASETPTTGPEERELKPDRTEIYRKVGDSALEMHLFLPPGHRPQDQRPAIVFFFGGGWKGGTPRQFFPQCQYLAQRGMVALSAEYRVYDRQRAMVVDCVADAQSAVRWARANSKRLGIDPDRIAAGGGSAGGHLAAATALLEDLTGDEDATIGFRPNALVLFNPALDLTLEPGGARQRLRIEDRFGAPAEKLSPADHIRPGLPPTIIFHGQSDALIPFASIEAFAARMQKAGNRCEVVGFSGQGHGFFNYGRGSGRYFRETMDHTEHFLRRLGYLSSGEATTRPAESKEHGR